MIDTRTKEIKETLKFVYPKAKFSVRIKKYAKWEGIFVKSNMKGKARGMRALLDKYEVVKLDEKGHYDEGCTLLFIGRL